MVAARLVVRQSYQPNKDEESSTRNDGAQTFDHPRPNCTHGGLGAGALRAWANGRRPDHVIDSNGRERQVQKRQVQERQEQRGRYQIQGYQIQGCQIQGCTVQGCKVQGCQIQGQNIQGRQIQERQSHQI